MANPSPWSTETGTPTRTRNDKGFDREDPRQFARDHTRHPQGGGLMNKEIQERRESEKDLPKKEAPERSKDTLKDKTKDKFQASNLAMQAQELRSKLGQTADEIMGYADSFLKSGTARIEGLDVQGGVEFNPDTGSYEITGGLGEADFGSMAEQKYAELQGLREAANTFFTQNEETGQWEARNFSDVVAEHYNELNPDERMGVDMEVDKLLSIAEKLNRLDQIGQGESAEAYSLRRQLELEDKNGLVSGLYQAKQRVDDLLSGETSFYGDEGDEGYTVADLLNLTRDDIEEELQKAAASSSGLFGGDFEAAIERTLDKESEEYQNYLKEERGFRNTLGRAGRNYFSEMKRRFSQAAGRIKEALDGVTPEIMEQMGDSVDSELAREWFTALQTGDSEDFADVMTELIYDPNSGIDAEDRRTLARYVGDVLKSQGIDLGIDEESALLTDAIRELEQTGQITWTGENGVTSTVTPTGIDKERILIAMSKGEDALKEEFKNLVNGQGIRLDKTLQQITDDGSYASLERATTGFRDAIVDSLDTFKGSESEQALSYAASGGNPDAFNNMSEAEKSSYMLDYLRSNPNITEDIIKSKVDDAKSTFNVQKKALEQQFETLGSAYNRGLEKVRDTLERLGTSRENTSEVFSEYLKEMDQGISRLSERQYKQLLGTQKVNDLLQSGTIDEDELRVASDLVSKMEYLRLLQQQGNDVFSAVERKLSPRQRDFVKEYISPDYGSGSIGNQVSYRSNLINKVLDSSAKNDGMADTYNRILNNAIGSLSMEEVPSVKNYLEQVRRDMDLATQAGRTYQRGLQQVENRRNLLGELEGRFDKTLEGMVNPETIGIAAQRIARQLEEQGATTINATDLGGRGDRQDLVGRQDPMTELRADVPRPDLTYQMQDIEGDLRDVDLGDAVTDTGMAQYQAPTEEEILSGETRERDKRIMVNPEGRKVIGDLVTGRVYDTEGNVLEGFYIDPQTGRMVDNEGNETGDYFRTTFDSRWLEDPGMAEELSRLTPEQRVAVTQHMESVARENVQSAEGGGVPADDRDVIAEGADMARFMAERDLVSNDPTFIRKVKKIDELTSGSLERNQLIDVANYVSDTYAKRGTSFEDEVTRLAANRTGGRPSKQDIDKAYIDLLNNQMVIDVLGGQAQKRNQLQDQNFNRVRESLVSRFGIDADEADLLAITVLNEDGTIDERELDALYGDYERVKSPQPAKPDFRENDGDFMETKKPTRDITSGTRLEGGLEIY